MKLKFKTKYTVKTVQDNIYEVLSITGYVCLGPIPIWQCDIPKMYYQYRPPYSEEQEIHKYIEAEFATRLNEVLMP